MAYESDIQWFPGHMTKTRRLIEADLKLVDAVAEVVDCRIPESSRNPMINEIVANKPRIIILNKCDQADENITSEWRKFYESKGIKTIVCDCRSGKGINRFLPVLKSELSELLERRRAKGMIGKALRVMVVGIPNVGKSSFINRMSNSRKTRVEDRPGVTRGKQWLSLENGMMLLDTPGILWPKFEDRNVGVRLALIGSINDDILNKDDLALNLISFLGSQYGGLLHERYEIEEESDEFTLLKGIAVNRKCFKTGEEPDISKAAALLLDDFRKGRLGRISLESPE